MYCRKWDSKNKLSYYKVETRKLGDDKVKKKKKNYEYDIWSFILTELEDLREQFNFLGNDKLLLKEQLDNFKSNKIQLFKKGQFCNGTCAV